jgi:hypothetical protein
MNNVNPSAGPGNVDAELKAQTKDFADHLRTVHFALLATCLGLTVVMLAPSPLAIRNARQQLDEITEAARVWHSDLVQRAAETVIDKNYDCRERSWHGFIQEIDGKQYAITFSGPNWLIQADYPLTRDGFPTGRPVNATRQYGIAPPKTLEEFRTFWDSPPSLLCVTDIGQDIWFEKNGETRSVPIRTFGFDPKGDYGTLEIDDNGDESIPARLRKTAKVFYRSGNSYDPPYLIRFEIPIDEDGLASFPLTVRDMLIDSSRFQWKHARFQDAFPELNTITTGFQHLGFADLKLIIRNEEQRTSEVFEAFGQKFPIETTARWGILIILGIQLYLWLHLCEYRKRGFRTSDTAWIGGYSALSPRIVFYFTGMVVPIGVVVFACLFRAPFGTNDNVFTKALLVCACCLSATLAVVSIREHRKDLRPDSETLPRFPSEDEGESIY